MEQLSSTMPQELLYARLSLSSLMVSFTASQFQERLMPTPLLLLIPMSQVRSLLAQTLVTQASVNISNLRAAPSQL